VIRLKYNLHIDYINHLLWVGFHQGRPSTSPMIGRLIFGVCSGRMRSIVDAVAALGVIDTYGINDTFCKDRDRLGFQLIQFTSCWDQEGASHQGPHYRVIGVFE
jgi:hypothetical protein